MPESKLIFETEYWNVILMPEQAYLGRCVIPLKRSCSELSKVTEEELLDFLQVVRKLEFLLKKTFNATLFNWSCLMNNTYQEENPNPQVHWHFRPRYDHEIDFAGEKFSDPNFGHHYIRGDVDGPGKRIVTEDILEKVFVELKSNL